MCLSSYDLFEKANIHYIVHQYVNSYTGTLLWTTITMLDGSQFTSMICWLYLETSRNYISFFMDGYFTFQKTDCQFSLMGLDRIHQQSNAVMKGMGGATSSLNKVDESSLARWGLCIHELASIVCEYEFEENNMNSPHEAQRHHEDSVAFQKRFNTDVNCLEKAANSNPFMLEKLTVLNNHDQAKSNDRVFEDIKIIETEREKRFLHFWEKRLVSAELSINVPIPLNSYKFSNCPMHIKMNESDTLCNFVYETLA